MTNQKLIKEAFLRVKKDILILEKENLTLKNQISSQNESFFKIKGVLSEILNALKELKEAKKEVSSGNDGVNQSINHLINQSINQSNTNQSFNQSNEPLGELESPITPIKHDFKLDNQKIFNTVSNQSINQSITNQSFNQSINHSDPNFQALRTNLEGVFRLLSKQELKLFLTIYQLEDEGKEPFYTAISSKMGLSEHCIRSHLFSLFKKNAPLYKKRLNNKRNIIHIKPDFKALNLKQKLIGIYYDSDPHQTTLFDI